jgi:3-oxoacyl-[acyl-carrier-protein] synthase-3
MDPISVKESIHPHPMLPSDAETIAGALAIIKSGLDKDDIDLLLSHSQVQDRPLPSNTSLIQHKLKLNNSGAYGVDTCCSTFVTMVELASALVKTGVKKNVLIVNSILDSMITDRSDYHSVVTGDAAFAAVVTESSVEYGYIDSTSTSHGARHAGVIFKHREPHLHTERACGPDYKQDFVTFFDKEVCREIGAQAVPDFCKVVEMLEHKTNISVEKDVDFFVTHQPVAWAGNVWREALKVPEEKFYQSFEKYANIATCSVPANLMEAVEKGLIKENDLLLMASSGAGENHIALYQRIDPRLIKNIQSF